MDPTKEGVYVNVEVVEPLKAPAATTPIQYQHFLPTQKCAQAHLVQRFVRSTLVIYFCIFTADLLQSVLDVRVKKSS